MSSGFFGVWGSFSFQKQFSLPPHPGGSFLRIWMKGDMIVWKAHSSQSSEMSLPNEEEERIIFPEGPPGSHVYGHALTYVSGYDGSQ